MKKLDYWMLGRVSIPKDKRDELNRYVLEVLDKGGIRLTEEIEIAGELITVVNKPIPDEEGIINFNYSVFEEIERKTCTYNTKTCQLKLKDPGGNEFGLIMNLIMVLQEAYSITQCYLMLKDNISSVRGYLDILYGLLGKKFFLINRSKTWDMFLFLRNSKVDIDINTLTGIPYGYVHMIEAQFRAGISIILNNFYAPDEQEIIHNKSEVAVAPYPAKEYFAYEAIGKLYEKEKDSLETYIYQLASSNLKERKKLANQDNLYGDIATVSLYVLPAMIISIFIHVSKKDFWDLWNGIEKKPYKSILGDGLEMKPDRFDRDGTQLPLFEVFQRKNEDEFMESWGEKNLILSDKMIDCFKKWKSAVVEAEDIPQGDVEDYLRDTIKELYDAINCRYVDKAFIKVILKNKDNPNYRKLLVAFRKAIYSDCALFPELTVTQSKSWVIDRWRDPYDTTLIMGWHSIIINEAKRKEIMGF